MDRIKKIKKAFKKSDKGAPAPAVENNAVPIPSSGPKAPRDQQKQKTPTSIFQAHTYCRLQARKYQATAAGKETPALDNIRLPSKDAYAKYQKNKFKEIQKIVKQEHAKRQKRGEMVHIDPTDI